jgi:predicted secreted hydrolase
MYWKKQSSVIVLLLVLLIPLATSYVGAQDPFWYQPHDASLADNAYNQTSYFSLQWWYLDATFNNSFSVHVGLLTIGAQATNGFFLVQINIYDNGTLYAQRLSLIPLRLMSVSTQEPFVRYQGKELLQSYLNQDDRLCVAVNLTIKDLQVVLLFTGVTQGWIGTTNHGMWGCPLPRATVNGTLTIKGSQIPVHGSGYQEHGWDVRRLHRSWYWGKFTSNHMNVVFSQSMKNRWDEDVFLAMVNNPDNNYTSIQRKNISLVQLKSMYSHGRFIPVESFLTIQEGLYSIHVRLVVKSIDFKNLGLIHYWRFHAQITGVITYDGISEEVNDVQIMEIFHLP